MPLARKCKQEMAEGNYAQYACRNATVEANLFDYYTVQLNYDKVRSVILMHKCLVIYI